MRLAPLILVGSVAANLACALLLALRPSLAPPAVRDLLHLRDAATEARLADDARRRDASAAQQRAAQAAASRALLWSALDSADLKTLVAHLRAAGFAPAHIRAIVNARLEARFAARRRELVGAAVDTHYWKPAPIGWNNSPKIYDQLNQLYRDRAAALRDILGDTALADSGDEATDAQRRKFGDLPKAKIALLQRIDDDYTEMIAQVRAGMQGVILPEDREKLALLEREKRADLAAVLTPDELRDYDLRNSTIATRLRSALTVMDATEAEYRAIYAITEPLADRIYPPGGVKGAEMARARREAEKLVADQLAAALGPARAADYARATDSDFQQFYRLAQRENLPPAAAVAAYDLRNRTGVESRRIEADTTLDPAAKVAAQQALAQSARTGLLAALGPNVGASYVNAADWLKHLAGGGSVSFERGGTTFYSPPKPGK